MCTTAFQQGLSSADNASSSIPYLYTPATALAWNATPGLLDASYAYTSGTELWQVVVLPQSSCQ